MAESSNSPHSKRTIARLAGSSRDEAWFAGMLRSAGSRSACAPKAQMPSGLARLGHIGLSEEGLEAGDLAGAAAVAVDVCDESSFAEC